MCYIIQELTRSDRDSMQCQMEEAQKLREVQVAAITENLSTLRSENNSLRDRIKELERAEENLQGQRIGELDQARPFP